MPNTINTGITGTDGKVPVMNANNRFQVWGYHELYLGGVGENRFVPNVKDMVIDTDTFQWYKVVSVDQITLIPTLEVAIPVAIGNFTDDSLLMGVGPGTQSDTYRVYIDKSVTPHTLAVDARLSVGGSMTNHAVIYRGSQLDGSAVAISAIYDQTGQLLGQAVPLEVISIDNITNVSRKVIPVCHTLADLPDGEVVTAVIYSDTGKVVSKRQLLVENTAFIRNSNAAVRYITAISLESPFLSETDNTLIQYPINVPLSGLNLMGVVTYSDGEQIRLPVDGTKFQLFGFSGFISTIIGQQFPLVLRYDLSPGEIVYGSQAVGGQFMTERYKAITARAEGAYTVKLFGYPVWIDANNGYRMEWFLYTLDRSIMYRVTPYVNADMNAPAFDPTAYGVVQHLAVNLNLRDVNGTFKAYNHVQVEHVTLLRPATDHSATPWTIAFTAGQNPQYGTNCFAQSVMTNQNMWSLNVASGSATLADWLARMYDNTQPLTNPDWEVVPPTPTHFSLLFGTDEIEYPIASWNTTLNLTQAVPNNTTLFVKLTARTPDNVLQLGIFALPVYQA